MATQKETSKVRTPIKKWLESEGWRVWKNAASAFSESGLSDLMALKDGKFICIETKLPGEKATAMQERFLRQMSESGAFIAIVACSVDDVKRAIRCSM